MIKPLEDLLERVKSWPAPRQEEVARMLEAMERSGPGVFRLSDAERALLEVGLDQSKRGELIPEAEMEAFWNRNRP